MAASASALIVGFGALLSFCGTASQSDGVSSKFACDLDREQWQEYRAAYEAAAQAAASHDDMSVSTLECPERRATFARTLLVRTSNISDVITCNVGIVAGYFLLARLASPQAVQRYGLVSHVESDVGLAYRLLQLALIFIFTLRNANRIPEGPGAAWGVSEQYIIPTIMNLKKRHDFQQHAQFQRAVPISPNFRDVSLRIAVVSICAYPADHPLALPRVTPLNRERYGQRHGYAVRMHLEPPVLGAHGLGVQHAKLATVLSYLQSGEFDWVAWLDCDSIIMNMERTLDSIIYQYTQMQAPESQGTQAEPAEPVPAPVPVCGSIQAIDLSGTWLDSFVPEGLREEAAVELHQTASGGVTASARQFGGSATGRVLISPPSRSSRGSRPTEALEEELESESESESLLELELRFPLEDGVPLRGRLRGQGGLSGRRRNGNGNSQEAEPGVEFVLDWENGAVWTRLKASAKREVHCRQPCGALAECPEIQLSGEVDLLITEEGWGLSSANWLIRRSAWSLNFLHAALTAAHVELRLFGDQDAMILHLLNRQVLAAAAEAPESLSRAVGCSPVDTSDPLDPHARIIPQFELNSYDALNALTMDCDTFVEGDLLVTFPQCKEAESCNDLFELASRYATDPDKPTKQDQGAWWLRREDDPLWAHYHASSSSALRIFGPRPTIRELFLRERG